MSDTTAIEWTDATFNPWWGCTKVGPGCDNCYAEGVAKVYQHGRVLWGAGAERRVFGEKHWNEPLAWDARAAREGRRIKVFCASMADVFDRDAPPGLRSRLWKLMVSTPNLDWQLLTKRIGNVMKAIPPAWWISHWPSNVWLGATVCNQEEAERDVPKLIDVRGNVPVRFLSIEPMLGPIRLHPSWLHSAGVSWVIAGGESGPRARPMHPLWVSALRDQCEAADVPFLFKQWGEWTGRVDGAEPRQPGTYMNIAGRTVTEEEALTSGGAWKGMWKLGKKRTGRELDGRTYDGFPR